MGSTCPAAIHAPAAPSSVPCLSFLHTVALVVCRFCLLRPAFRAYTAGDAVFPEMREPWSIAELWFACVSDTVVDRTAKRQLQNTGDSLVLRAWNESRTLVVNWTDELSLCRPCA